MTTALNLTCPLKQDAASQQQLQQLKEHFAEVAQPAIDAALAKSHIVHFARVLVIDDKYIQVITEFDGDKNAYTEFFRRELPGVFKAIFDLVEGAPPWDELNNTTKFFEVASGLNVRALGNSSDGDPEVGYLFSAVGDKTVREIQDSLQQSSTGTS
jgi:hypothetical protein